MTTFLSRISQSLASLSTAPLTDTQPGPSSSVNNTPTKPLPTSTPNGKPSAVLPSANNTPTRPSQPQTPTSQTSSHIDAQSITITPLPLTIPAASDEYGEGEATFIPGTGRTSRLSTNGDDAPSTPSTATLRHGPEEDGNAEASSSRMEPEKRRRRRSTLGGNRGSVVDGVEGEVEGEGEKGGRRKKKKTVYDTYVFVRPPPSSGKRPMNLQVQLVVNADKGKHREGIKSRSNSTTSIASTIASAASPGLDSGPFSTEPVPIASTSHLSPNPNLPSRATPSPPATPSPIRKTSITIADPPTSSRVSSFNAAPVMVRTVSDQGSKSRDGRPAAKRASTSSLRGTGDEAIVGIMATPTSSAQDKEKLGAGFRSASTTGSERSSLDEAEGKPKRSTTRLSRASSIGSQTSTASNVSGISGISDSSGGKVGRGRRIMPMYNLSVHNVMTTFVTDAANDEKVAKFQKKSIEISGLGQIDATEIWSPFALLDTRHSGTLSQAVTRTEHGRSSPELEDGGEARGRASLDGAVRALNEPQARSAMNGNGNGTGSAGEKTMIPANGSTNFALGSGRTKKFFGKLFNKKAEEEAAAEAAVAAGSSPSTARQSIDRHPAERLLSPMSPQTSRNPFTPTAHANSINPNITLSVPNPQYALPTFGLQPNIAGSSDASLGEGSLHRPMGYTWTIKRWAVEKGGDQAGMLAGLTARFAGGAAGASGSSSGTANAGEVVIEWSRSKGKLGRMSRTGSGGQTTLAIGQGQQQRNSIMSLPLPERKGSGLQDSVSDEGHGVGNRLSVASTGGNLLTARPGLGPGRASDSSRPNSLLSIDEAAPSIASTTSIPRNRSRPRNKAGHPMSNGDSPGSRSPSPSLGSSKNDPPDDGEESDPEDSETPWECRLYLPRGPRRDSKTSLNGQHQHGEENKAAAGAETGPTSSPGEAGFSRKRPVRSSTVMSGGEEFYNYHHQLATLYPAPHHPKVVAQVKIPSTLGEIPTGIDLEEGREVVLSEKDVRDLVCVTGMWVIVREEFGGLGRRKKGV